jgi:phosphatidylglycerol---prolipoprotein diacylglyceryl transferase
MHQVAFTIGTLKVHWYGILVVAGFVAGLWTASRRCVRDGISSETIADMGPWLMLAAIVGARIAHVVWYWQEEFADKPWWEMFAIHHGGLVFYGGLVGASLATVFYARARRIDIWKLADGLAPSIALGQALGRVGCLLNGCCYGIPTQAPWAAHYPPDHATQGVGVHPTQIYEAALNLLLYLGLAGYYRRKTRDGEVFAAYLIAYALLRIGVEFFRGDYAVRYLGGNVTPGQAASLVALGAGCWLSWSLRRRDAARV